MSERPAILSTSERLRGKVALVTGSSRGIGRAIAERFASEGALVAVHYGHGDTAAATTVQAIEMAGGRAFAIKADLPREIVKLYEELDSELTKHAASPKFDILVNNAAIVTHMSMEAITEEQFDRTLAVNIKGPYFMVKYGLSRMRDGGRIINVSSGASRLAYPESSAYALTKGAINNLSLALAKQLGPRKITVNTLAPGMTVTEMSEPLLTPDVIQFFSTNAALGRLAQTEDIAGAAIFLASEDARWVTGTYLEVSGGLLI
jgi:NAD(P)-dependent dehydrogenase (short-subunit alcohol dehydrogenase family)